MKRLAILSFFLVAACGGSTPTDSTSVTPPPPVTPGPPASLVVQAGDGQLAEPGITLPVRPAVLVKDASGLALSGIAVTFAVDSGGGTLSTTSAITGSNGVATAGDWKLGPAEGRNVLRVSVGALVPGRMAATAIIQGTTLSPLSVPASGGSYEVSQAGPLQGFKIDVPAGAFTAPFAATVRYTSNSAVARNAAINPVSPLITIGTLNADVTTLPLRIHVAGEVPDGSIPQLVVYDPATGLSKALVTLSWDAHGITALTNTLNTGSLLSSPAALRAGILGAFAADPGMSFYMNTMPTSVLMADYDSGFRPGVDDWEFSNTTTETSESRTGAGITLASYWYFVNKPSTQKLNGRWVDVPSIPTSNRRGLRWASEVGEQADPKLINLADAVLQDHIASPTNFDQNVFNTIRANFALAALKGVVPTPELVALQSLQSNGQFTAALQVYRCQGDKLFVADPLFPGDAALFLQFPAADQMRLYTPGARGTAGGFRFPYTLTLGLLLSPATLASQYQQVVAGTIGNAAFPAHEFHTWGRRLYDTLYVVDTLRFWSECAACSRGYRSTLSPIPGKVANGLLYQEGASAGWSAMGTVGTNGLLVNATTYAPGTVQSLGVVDLSALTEGATAGGKWLDWHRFKVIRLAAAITPDPKKGPAGAPLSLKFETNTAQLPPKVTYKWDFGDGKPKVTKPDDPNVQHVWDAAGTYPVTVDVIDVRNDQVIARATSTATITTPQYAWKFQSASIQGIVLPQGGIGGEKSDTLAQQLINGFLADLQSSPANSALFVYGPPDCLTVYMEQFAAGQATYTDLLPAAVKGVFASCSDEPYFTGNFAMGPLGNGTLIGQLAPSVNLPEDYLVIGGGAINATMTGATLRGTFTWNINYSTGMGRYTVLFQAVQVEPSP